MKNQISNSIGVSKAIFALPVERRGAREDRKLEPASMSLLEIRKLIEEIMG